MKKQDFQSKSIKKGNRQTELIALKDIHAIGKRIKYFRVKKGMEQKDIAQKVGISTYAVCSWESGRTRPDLSILPLLCDILGITLYDLYGIDTPIDRLTEKEIQVLSAYRDLSASHQLVADQLLKSLKESEEAEKCPDITMLTLCSKQLAAGFDSGAEFEDAGEPIYLYSSDLVRQADLVFPVSGNSMEPEYHDGDLVLVQRYPGSPELQYGEIGAFITGNSTYIKVYEKDGLHSLNKRYKTLKFSEDDSVFLIGRVLGILDPNDIATSEDIIKYQRMQQE